MWLLTDLLKNEFHGHKNKDVTTVNSFNRPTSNYNHHPDSDLDQEKVETIYKRVVIKAGTSVLTGDSTSEILDQGRMADLVFQLSQLNLTNSTEVLLVSSGAIAAGREILGQATNVNHGRNIINRQMLAAIGQGRLIHLYQELFAKQNVQVAQTLLTVNDISERHSYLNLRNTLLGLLELNIIPILNENDVVAVDEIGEVFGDNDRLSALVATLVDADLLVILTDIDGLYTSDPKTNPKANLVPIVELIDSTVDSMVGEHLNPLSRGGMFTKIQAARLVTTAGIPMIICNGNTTDSILKAVTGDTNGTLFRPAGGKLEARKRWMLSQAKDTESGEILIDQGAVRALVENRVSLLPAGIMDVQGQFERGEILFITDNNGTHIACGIANYSSSDIISIKGSRSDRILDLLGYYFGQEVVHRNNLVLL